MGASVEEMGKQRIEEGESSVVKRGRKDSKQWYFFTVSIFTHVQCFCVFLVIVLNYKAG